jgi:hypothetical protein
MEFSMKNSPILATFIASLLLSTSASARQTEAWPYERLFQEADVVVIAVAIKSIPKAQSWPGPKFNAQLFRGVVTQFRVVSTAKGPPTKTIQLLHYKYADSTTPINDGPGLVTFLSGPISIDVHQYHDAEPQLPVLTQKRLSRSTAPEYLLFLKKGQDGFFEAVSGQLDPNFSVRALFNVEALQSE